MSKTNGNAFPVAGCVAIAATLLLYFWIFDDVFTTPVKLIALATLLLAEAIAIVKIWLIRDAVFARATATVSGVHIALVAATSLLFIALNPESPKAYILLNLLFLAATSVVDIALFRVAKDDGALVANQKAWNTIVSQAERLRVRYADSEYAPKLEALAETARYSDNTASTDKDAAVASALDALSGLLTSSDANAIEAQISAVAALIEERNVDARASKRGAY